MKARTVLLIVIAISILSILAGTVITAKFLLMDPIVAFEEDQARDDAIRAGEILGDDIEALRELTYDWAAWDDTYSFVADPTDAYIRSNLVDETFTGSRLDCILYFDTTGELVYGKAYDFREEEPAAVPPEIADQLRSHGLIGNPKTAMERTSGILMLPGGPMEVAIEPILRSDDSGPPRGKLLMGRRFDETAREGLEEIVLLDLSVEPWDPSAVPTPSPSTSPWLTISPDGRKIKATTRVDDIFGEPAFLLCVHSERTLYTYSSRALSLFLVTEALIGFAVIVWVGYHIDRKFLRRVERLKDWAGRIARTGEESCAMELEGDDEISDLARTFDRTFRALRDHTAREREATEKYRRARKKLSVLSGITRHDILNQVTVVIGNATLLADHIRGNPEAEDRLSRINHAARIISDLSQFTRLYEQIGEEPAAWMNIAEIVRLVADQIVPPEIDIEILTGDLEVFCDPLIERAFYILLDNAVNHGESLTRIRVRFEEDGLQGRLIVEDDGVGVPHGMKETIFAPNIGRNSGMGLFLAREILDFDDMSIRETGEPGAGARFEILIPPGRYRRAGEESA